MTTRTRRAPINLAAAQKQALAFVTDFISTKPLGLPDLTESDFTDVMNAITRSMLQAWAAGYMTRDEEIGR